MSSSPSRHREPLSSPGQHQHHHQGSPRARSQFTYRHLSQMAQYATSSPLRVVAHVDLDAFYAQCEMVRLGLPDDQPLAVQQWQSLIAINYPARKSGIGGRLGNVADAKKACPQLIAQHVATWREGDDGWAYRDDAAASIATDKVALDPYRLESRKILALVHAHLPQHLQRVEKASVDEVYLDLSAQVHAALLQRFPELRRPPPYHDASERLPLPSVTALDWQDDALVGLDDEEREAEDPDWDDVAILVGSEIVRGLRAEVRAKLGYTCSAGIARNKLLSKLGSGYRKPNRQTVVRGRAVDAFLRDFRLAKIRNLGGKLGEQVASLFGAETVRDLVPVPLEQLRARLGDDETAAWLYNTIRGVDAGEVSARTQIKSMLSAKSFRPHIGTVDQAVRWLRIFVGDIYNRLVGEGVLEERRRPKTIHLSARQATTQTTQTTRSRQVPIPPGKRIDEALLMKLARDLLSQMVGEGGGGGMWPCTNLSLTVGGFEDGVRNNMGIGAFLVKGDAAISLKTKMAAAAAGEEEEEEEGRGVDGVERMRKRARGEEGGGGGIRRFFAKEKVKQEGLRDGEKGSTLREGEETTRASVDKDEKKDEKEDEDDYAKNARDMQLDHDADGRRRIASQQGKGGQGSEEFRQKMATAATAAGGGGGDDAWLVCGRCDASFGIEEELQSHMDWHMAKDMEEEEEEEERGRRGFGEVARRIGGKGSTGGGGRGRGRGRGRGGRLEQGQRTLQFGRG